MAQRAGLSGVPLSRWAAVIFNSISVARAYYGSPDIPSEHLADGGYFDNLGMTPLSLRLTQEDRDCLKRAWAAAQT